MNPRDMIPGLRKYPDLEDQMRRAIASNRGCSGDCGHAKLADDFRRRLQKRLERDKWLK